MTYATVESALITQLQTLTIFNTYNCVVDDIDGAFAYANKQTSGSDYRDNVLSIDYGGGSSAEKNIWTHVIDGILAVRVEGLTTSTGRVNAGTKFRTSIEAVRGLLFPNNRLSNTVARCRLTDMGRPFVFEKGGIWWAVTFTVEIDEDPRTC